MRWLILLLALVVAPAEAQPYKAFARTGNSVPVGDEPPASPSSFVQVGDSLPGLWNEWIVSHAVRLPDGRTVAAVASTTNGDVHVGVLDPSDPDPAWGAVTYSGFSYDDHNGPALLEADGGG